MRRVHLRVATSTRVVTHFGETHDNNALVGTERLAGWLRNGLYNKLYRPAYRPALTLPYAIAGICYDPIERQLVRIGNMAIPRVHQ